MAEIHVQPKGPRLWPWFATLGVVAALLIIGRIWWNDDPLVVSSGDIDLYPASVEPIPATVVFPVEWASVRRYDEFTTRPSDFGDFHRAHAYTRNGFQYLAAAIQEVSGDSAPVGKVAAVRESAQALAQETTTDYAQMFAVTARQAAEALREVQQARYPELSSATAGVSDAAKAIEEDAGLLGQGDRIRAFFAEAAELLRQMGAAPSPGVSDTGGVR
jgi:hypothetical protein